MSVTLEEFLPSANGSGKIGKSGSSWGQGWFTALYVNGSAVAPLASPTFTGTPAAPTASPGTNTTQLATTAFVAAASALDRARANHTGSQLAATISDFDAAVTASTAGAKAHNQNSDTSLAHGTGNAVTAAALRTHLDDDSKHRVINNAGTGATDLWSASKIISELASVSAGEPAYHQHTLDEVSDAGALAALDTVDTAQIDNGAITGPKVAGGEVDPGPSKYWGTNTLNQFGFHAFPGTPKASTSSGEGLISQTGGLHVVLGTDNNRAASGADSRFPTSSEKAALAGQTGTPSISNKYLTFDWIATAGLSDAAITAGSSTTKGLVSPAQIKAAIEEHESDTPAAGGLMIIERELEDSGDFGGSTGRHIFIATRDIVIERIEGEYAAAGDGAISVTVFKNATSLGSVSLTTSSSGSSRLYGASTVNWSVAAGERVSLTWGDGSTESEPPTLATGPLYFRIFHRPATP